MLSDSSGPEVDIRAMQVCRICSDVHGVAWERGSAESRLARHQLCRCVIARGGIGQWPGYDFPTAVELCRCCGSVALRSGSRWSDWFCEVCKPAIETVNQACGFCVLPPGRHSLMGRRTLGSVYSTIRLPKFALALQDWFERIEILERHSARIILRNLASLELSTTDTDVALPCYLERFPRTDQVVADAVRKLGREAGIPQRILKRALS